jgi:CDP-glycerol glycerophosphotransferase (TagB/SpsB family)
MPRFDELNFNNKENNEASNRNILVIPASRLYIKGSLENPIFESIYSDLFKSTEYFEYYNNLINDKRLLKFMEIYNYTGVFCLSPYFSAQWIDFKNNKYFAIKDVCNFHKLILNSSLLITDYSSIFFDFGYLKKPIIYTHFDYLEYRKLQYPEGYFKYENDGFGPICKNINQTVDSIIKHIQNNCSIEEKYLNRIQTFFTFFDSHNSERIYEQIIDLNSINDYNSMIYLETFHVSFSLVFILIKIGKKIKIF